MVMQHSEKTHGDMQVFLYGGRSLTILENLWRGLYWILKTSLSPKDQKELITPFSKCSCEKRMGAQGGIKVAP